VQMDVIDAQHCLEERVWGRIGISGPFLFFRVAFFLARLRHAD